MKKVKFDRNAWIVRIACFWGDKTPAEIDGCTLWRRFLLRLVPWFVSSALYLIIGGLVFGVLAHIIVQPFAVLFVGKRLAYKGPPTGVFRLPFYYGLHRLFIGNYRFKNVKWLDWAEFGDVDKIRSPILILIMAIVLISMIYMFIVAIPHVFFGIVDEFAWAGRAALDTVGWWGSGILVIVGTGIVYFGGRRTYGAFIATESGKFVLARYQSWKERHCTLYELV
jgi:hypothetical protein